MGMIGLKDIRALVKGSIELGSNLMDWHEESTEADSDGGEDITMSEIADLDDLCKDSINLTLFGCGTHFRVKTLEFEVLNAEQIEAEQRERYEEDDE
jgi:hypothetical protein